MIQPENNVYQQNTNRELADQRDDYAIASLASLTLTAFAGVDYVFGNASGLHEVADVAGYGIGLLGDVMLVPKAIRMHLSIRNRAANNQQA